MARQLATVFLLALATAAAHWAMSAPELFGREPRITQHAYIVIADPDGI